MLLNNYQLFLSFDKASQLEPEETYFWVLKGALFKELNRLDEALEWLFLNNLLLLSYNEALQIEP